MDDSESREAAAAPGLMALIAALTKRAEFPLVFLWLTLGIEVVITSQLVAEEHRPPKVRAPGRDESWHDQYVFLLMVLLATIFFTLATSVYVRLVANNWQLSKVWALSVCTELVAGASAAILFVLVQSVNVVAVAVFAPPVLLFTTHAYHLVRRLPPPPPPPRPPPRPAPAPPFPAPVRSRPPYRSRPCSDTPLLCIPSRSPPGRAAD